MQTSKESFFANLTVGKIIKLVGAGIIAIFAIVMICKSWVEIPSGTAGVKQTFGAINQVALDEGIHFKLPWQNVTNMTVRLTPHKTTNHAASRDLQRVTTEVTVTYSLVPSYTPGLFQKIGTIEQIDAAIINPGVQESVKAVTAEYTAEQLITRREHAKGKVEDQIRKYIAATLKSKSLDGALAVTSVAITDFDFSNEFNKSIEAKVQAEQDALRAENKKRQTITEAEAKRDSEKAKADGEAYTITTKSKAEADAIERKAAALAKNPNLIQYEAVHVWNGALPTTLTGNAPLPFINIGKGNQ
jgi:regulator of protease activity HflC (stomatin/prohibitin superfamily)